MWAIGGGEARDDTRSSCGTWTGSGFLLWTQNPQEEDSLFYVKTTGKLRLIIDARRANLRFQTPGVDWCTGEGLA